MHLDNEAREQLLRDSWLKHDALWYRFCYEHLDTHVTNKGNRKIVERLAEFEMLSLIRKLKVNSTNFNTTDILSLFEVGLDIYQTHNSPVTIKQISSRKLQISITNCWACRALKEAGLLEKYECGPWGRLKGWLRALQVGGKLTPNPKTCLALTRPSSAELCQVEVVLPTNI